MKNEEKRKFPRIKSNGILRIYSGITSCKYSVKLSDISKMGAFIRTLHLPKVGEIITYTIVDEETLEERFIGNAKVKWIKEKNCHESEMGFGVELEKELQDEIIEELTKNRS